MPKTTDGLMRHMRDNKKLNIGGSKQKRQLRNIGYFHGYKGYNFYQRKENDLSYSEFTELHALYEFDTEIKTLFYRHVMFSETAIKNRILEIIHKESGYDLEPLFEKVLIDYKKHAPGHKEYKKKLAQTLRLRKDIYEKIHENCNTKPYISHYIYDDRPVPVYAVFELLTLGNMVFLTRCLKDTMKINLLKDLDLFITSFEKNEKIIGDLIDCLKGLRNAIAHNGVLYDCRFKDNSTGKQLTEYFNVKMKVKNLEFNRIVDYLAVIILICSSLGYSKTELKRIVREFETSLNKLRNELKHNISVYDKIIGTDVRTKINQINTYINNIS